jgi:tape measure domain-containing protein
LAITIAELVALVKADDSQYKHVMRDVDQTNEKVAGQGSKSWAAFGGAARTAGLAAGAGLGIAGAALVKVGFGFNSMREQSQIAFTTMLGSGEKAEKFLNRLQQFAAKTPFEFPDLVRSSQRLLAMGFTADQVLPTMTAVGDAVAGLGGNAETMERVTTALGQIQAKGKASAEEMMQLTEAGIPAWKMLADAIGVDVPTAMSMVTKGAIDAETTVKAVTEGMEKNFGGMMEKQSHTFAGLWSTVKDNFSMIAGTVMGPFFDLAEKGLGRLSEFLAGGGIQKGLESLKSSFGDTFGNAGEAMTGLVEIWQDHVLPVWQSVWDLFTDGVAAIAAVINEHRPEIEAIFTNLTEIVQNLWDVAEPILRLLFTVVLPAALKIAIPVIKDITEAIKDITGAMSYVSDNIGTAISSFVGQVRTMKKDAGDFIGDIVRFFKDLPGDVASAITNGAALVKKAVTGLFGNVIDWVKDALGIGSPSKIFIDIGENLVTSFIKGLGNKAGMLASAVKNMVSGFLPSFSAPVGTGEPGGGGQVANTGHLVGTVINAVQYAKQMGWHGQVTSGFRTYAEQAALYQRYLAGGPLAAKPGTSSHERGEAVDVTDYTTFGAIMRGAPAGSRLYNRLGAADPVHFSVSGYEKGGVVPGPVGAPQLAVVHGGETITPPGQGSIIENHTHVYLDSQEIFTSVQREALDFRRQNGLPAV